MWTFLRKHPNNKWRTYSGDQIYLGIDNQIRGGDADKNKAIRKLYRACIQIMSTRHPDYDVAQTHVYRDYQKGIVKVKDGDTWALVAKWHKDINKMVFEQDNTDYETQRKALMR